MLEPSPISMATAVSSPSTCNQDPCPTNTPLPIAMRSSPSMRIGGASTLWAPKAANPPEAIIENALRLTRVTPRYPRRNARPTPRDMAIRVRVHARAGLRSGGTVRHLARCPVDPDVVGVAGEPVVVTGDRSSSAVGSTHELGTGGGVRRRGREGVLTVLRG